MANNFEQTWRGLASILGGLLAGIFMAIGHHLYYASLEGASAAGDRLILGYLVSNQTLTISLGTAFSFIVRALLLFAISGAYVQLFWRAATHARKPNTLEEIDAMFSILSNLFGFSQGSVWCKYPSLLLIALVSWLLPIAFTIPSASLSVLFMPVTTSALKTVPNFDFASLRYVNDMPVYNWVPLQYPNSSYKPSNPITCKYNGPSYEVQRIANSVASRGAILPITPPAPNSSWQLDFYGPSLRCRPIDANIRLDIETKIAYWLWFKEKGNFTSRNCYEPPGYLAWSPSRKWITSSFEDLSYNLSLVPYDSFTNSLVAVSIVAAMPSLINNDDLCDSANVSTQLQPLGPGNMTLLQCNLRNSSYRAAFKYLSGSQSIEIQTDDKEEVFIQDFTIRFGNSADWQHSIFYESLFRSLSYTAIADAFYQIIKGSVGKVPSVGFVVETNMASTVLAEAPELSFLSSLNSLRDSISRDGPQDEHAKTTLQAELLRMNASRAQSFYSTSDMHQGKPLQHALEEMFQNITISMLSSELLQPNVSSEFAPPMPNVNITTYEPMYHYSFRQLWIAYGIAIMVSAISSMFGLLAIFFGHASYSSHFSSVFRTAYSSSLEVTMRPEDMKATDPLPKYIAKAALYISQLAPGDKQKALLANATRELSETLIERGIETVEGGDGESRVLVDSEARR
ncbi:hypothetical protein GGR51DRAFT_60601 [Nemania sp. FL0031]|nr:hypothetical protein GGR51DRAFT_60601 [Nemania sp. FL0031]